MVPVTLCARRKTGNTAALGHSGAGVLGQRSAAPGTTPMPAPRRAALLALPAPRPSFRPAPAARVLLRLLRLVDDEVPAAPHPELLVETRRHQHQRRAAVGVLDLRRGCDWCAALLFDPKPCFSICSMLAVRCGQELVHAHWRSAQRQPRRRRPRRRRRPAGAAALCQQVRRRHSILSGAPPLCCHRACPARARCSPAGRAAAHPA